MNRRDLIKLSLAAGSGLALPQFAKAAVRRSHDGWQPLFNGRNLDGWTFYQQGVGNADLNQAVQIDKGVLHFLGPKHVNPETSAGHIATVSEWENYHFRIDFRWGETRWPPRKWQRRNSGILYHMGPQTDRLFPDCVEFQVEEGDVGDAIMINTLALQGPQLGGTPLWPNWIDAFPSTYQEPVRAGQYARQWHRHAGHYERLDGWNTLDLIAMGDQSAHLVNGRIVNTLFKMLRTGPDGARVPMTRGRIALELEWAEVMFRNAMIRPLDAAAIALIRKQGSD